MKRISSPDSAIGPPLRTKMILFLLTAALSLLTLTAILPFLGLKGARLTVLPFNEIPFSDTAHFAIPLLILLYLGGLALIARLLSMIASINRSLTACAAYARAIAGNGLDLPTPSPVADDTAGLCSDLRSVTECLGERLCRINASRCTLVPVNRSLTNISRQFTLSTRLHGAALAQAAPAMDSLTSASRIIFEGIDQLDRSAASIAAATHELRETIREVTLSSDKLGDAFDEVSVSTSEMAASIREIGSGIVSLLDASSATATSVGLLDSSIKQVEKIALNASTISEEVKHDAETGKRAVEETIAGMAAIRTSSRITAEAMHNLSQRVDDIGVILSVIEEVAEQTDLLALNATIIAAQSGVHGKGFAVVADEIRELAERTSSSTREISMVIRGVQNETRRAVDALQQAEESINAGQKLSHHSGAALEKIVRGVQQADTEVRTIARTTVEQARGSQIIRESMQSVADMVQRIAASSTEHTQTSAQIALTVERMKGFNNQVRASTSEQSGANDLIARATEESMEAINRIRVAGNARTNDHELLATALGTMQGSLASTAESIPALDESRAVLERQLKVLEQETAPSTT